MREEEQSNRIYVSVDSSKIVRCKWCGTMECERWLHTGSAFFCSMACAHAEGAQNATPIFLCLAVLWPILMVMAAPTYLGRWEFWASIMPFMVIGLLVLCSGKKGMAYRRSVPRNSRRNEVPLDTALLRTVSTSVACPRCDANLDVRRIGKDRVYVCGYCGATGTVAVIDKSEQRGGDSGRSI